MLEYDFKDSIDRQSMAQRNREIAFVGYNCFVSSTKKTKISSVHANPLVGVHEDFQSAKVPHHSLDVS
jgi:hypothetical protein